jgi:hypothetical protein
VDCLSLDASDRKTIGARAWIFSDEASELRRGAVPEKLGLSSFDGGIHIFSLLFVSGTYIPSTLRY